MDTIPEELIHARIVFDTDGIGGAFGGGGAGKGAAGGLGVGKIAAGVAAGNALLGGIKKGLGMLVEASPRLQAQLIIFKKGIQLLLRPIANTLSLWLKPVFGKFLKIATKFYTDYASGGLMEAFGKLFDKVFGKTFIEKLKTGMQIAGVLALGFLGFKAIAVALGGLAIVGSALKIPAILFFGGFALADLFGLDGMMQVIAAGLGVAVFFLAGGGPLGAAIAVAAVLGFIGGAWLGDKLADIVKNWFKESKGVKWINETLVLPVIFTFKKTKEQLDNVNEAINQKGLDAVFQSGKEGKKERIGDVFGEATGQLDMIKERIVETDEASQSWMGNLLKSGKETLGWIYNKIFVGSSPAIVDFGPIMAENVVKSQPMMSGAFNSVFGMLDSMIEGSMGGVNSLVSNIMRLNRTVVTRHIIITERRNA